MKLCFSNEYLLFILLEQLKLLKNLLAIDLLRPIERAIDLYDSGILSRKSALAIAKFFPYSEIYNSYQGRKALVHLLFQELVDPTTLENYKDYARLKFNKSFELLNSMGKYYHDNFSYFISELNKGAPYLFKLGMPPT